MAFKLSQELSEKWKKSEQEHEDMKYSVTSSSWRDSRALLLERMVYITNRMGSQQASPVAATIALPRLSHPLVKQLNSNTIPVVESFDDNDEVILTSLCGLTLRMQFTLRNRTGWMRAAIYH